MESRPRLEDLKAQLHARGRPVVWAREAGHSPFRPEEGSAPDLRLLHQRLARDVAQASRGEVVSVIGPGRTSMALRSLVVGAVHPVVWVDPGGEFYAPGAFRHGLEPGAVFWVRPPDAVSALWAVHVLLSGGAASRVVFDLPAAFARMEGRREAVQVERGLERLRRGVLGSEKGLLVLAPVSVGGVGWSLTLTGEGSPAVRRGRGERAPPGVQPLHCHGSGGNQRWPRSSASEY